MERETNGAVLSLASISSRLVAGINSKLQVFKWVEKTGHIDRPELISVCGHHGHLLALMLKSTGNTLALGDILQSVTMIEFDTEKTKLVEVARDFTCNYMRAIEIIGDSTFVGAEDNCNIFFLHHDAHGKDSSRLDICGEFHVGEAINVFQHGTLSNRPMEQSSTDDESADHLKLTGSVNQSVLFGTVSGAIGTILGIKQETYIIFEALQKCIQNVVHSVGGLPHSDWRNFANEKRYGGQTNTIDGDLIETFLELNPAEMSKIVSLLNDQLAANPSYETGMVTVDMLRSRIEEISRCH